MREECVDECGNVKVTVASQLYEWTDSRGFFVVGGSCVMSVYFRYQDIQDLFRHQRLIDHLRFQTCLDRPDGVKIVGRRSALIPVLFFVGIVVLGILMSFLVHHWLR